MGKKWKSEKEEEKNVKMEISEKMKIVKKINKWESEKEKKVKKYKSEKEKKLKGKKLKSGNRK